MSKKGTFNDIMKNIGNNNYKFTIKNMKLRQLVEGSESLGIIMQQKMPIVIGYKISVFIKKINPEIEEFGKSRNELLNKHADKVPDEKGKPANQMKFKDQKAVDEFNEELNIILDQDVTVEVPDINITEFGTMEIEPKHLINLGWLIKQ